MTLLHSDKRQAGFTLVELVVVIVLLGILGTFVAPKFFILDDFTDRGYYDEIASANRYAQKLAVASGCDVRVVMNASGFTLSQRANCDTGSAFTRDLILPGKDSATVSAPGGTSVSPATTVIFSPLGSAIDAARNVTDFTFSVGGRSLTIVGETGFVDAP